MSVQNCLSSISVFCLEIFYYPISRIRNGSIILVQVYAVIIYPIVGAVDFGFDIAFHEKVAIRSETVVFPCNSLPSTYRIRIAFLHIPPAIVVVIIFYPALNVFTANPAISDMEPRVLINQNTSGCLNTSTGIQCFYYSAGYRTCPNIDINALNSQLCTDRDFINRFKPGIRGSCKCHDCISSIIATTSSSEHTTSIGNITACISFDCRIASITIPADY